MEFNFFLDAWCYCYQHHIDISKIKRLNWTTWYVDVPEDFQLGVTNAASVL